MRTKNKNKALNYHFTLMTRREEISEDCKEKKEKRREHISFKIIQIIKNILFLPFQTTFHENI